MKKYIIIRVLVVVLVIGLFPLTFISAKQSETVFAENATSVVDLQALIEELKNQIQQLQEQLKALKTEVQEVKAEIQLTKKLLKGMMDDEVKKLQEFLSQDSEVYPEGLVTGYFGPLTERAVKKFQEKHANDVLAPLGLAKGTGYVGEKTLAKINEMMAEEKIVICHYPPENPDNRHTIAISKSALDAHLAHGDIVGICPDSPVPSPTPTPTPTPCSESWSCSFWSTCVDNAQARICTDANSCGTTNFKPALSQSCISNPAPTPTPIPCSESWSCGSWSSCVNNTQTRICADANNCGAINLKPALNQSCTLPPMPNPTGTDLEISNLYTAHSYVGQSNKFITGITNRGSTVIPKGFVIKFYINDAYIGEYTHPVDLLPGWGGGFGINYTFANPGIYEVKAVVDGNNVIAELSEDNNIIIAKLNIITSFSSLPDLQVVGLGASHVYKNQPNNITASIKNVGLATSGGFVTKFYIDGNYAGETSYTGAMIPSGSSGVSGASINYTFTTAGNHELKMAVDANNAVIEESEENNTLSRIIYIQ